MDRLQNPHPQSVVTAANLDALRKNLGHIAEQTQPAKGGFPKPTPDAAAAKVALGDLRAYTENIPQNHIMAGDATDYVRQIKQANANWAAGSRVRDLDARLTKAENATERQIAGSIDTQIKSKAGSLLDNPQNLRGLTNDEISQLQLINSGTPGSNVLRQLGRGGAGVIPLGTHAASAVLTHGASLPYSLAIGIPLFAARKASEAITKGRANILAEMLAKRSPVFEERAAMTPPGDTAPMTAAIARALLAGAKIAQSESCRDQS